MCSTKPCANWKTRLHNKPTMKRTIEEAPFPHSLGHPPEANTRETNKVAWLSMCRRTFAAANLCIFRGRHELSHLLPEARDFSIHTLCLSFCSLAMMASSSGVFAASDSGVGWKASSTWCGGAHFPPD